MKIPNVIHKFYSLFGYSIELRIQSPKFKKDLKRLNYLMDNYETKQFRIEYAKACKEYDPNDIELLRMSWLAMEELEWTKEPKPNE